MPQSQNISGSTTTESIPTPKPFNPLNWDWTSISLVLIVLLLIGIVLRTTRIKKLVK